MQQTLESTLKRPALLHKRLITANTPQAIRAKVIIVFLKYLICAYSKKHVFRPTHSCCRLCVGVRRGGTSELPLTGLRTLLCIGQDDAHYYMLVNARLCTAQRRISFSKMTAKYPAHPLVVGSIDGKASSPALLFLN